MYFIRCCHQGSNTVCIWQDDFGNQEVAFCGKYVAGVQRESVPSSDVVSNVSEEVPKDITRNPQMFQPDF